MSTPTQQADEPLASPDYLRKIVSPERLAEIAAELRGPPPTGGRPKRIVQSHGCFDIVHPGHIRYLQFAKAQGDVLIVSITGDAAVDKGPQRPYIPQELRAESLAALEIVDYVVIDPAPTACRLLQLIRPDVYVKGHEYATNRDARFLAEREVIESYGGRVIFSSGEVVFSSSRLVEAISPSQDLAAERLSLLCRRHDITRDALTRCLEKMNGLKVLIVGDIAVDRYVLCDANTIAGESPMMALKELDAKDFVGGAAVIALQAAALGAEPILVTSTGKDDLSRWAEATLKAEGVRIEAVRHRSSLPLRTRFLVDDHKLFKVDRTCVRPLDSVGERDVAGLLRSEIARADAVILFDGGCGMMAPGLLSHLKFPRGGVAPIVAAGAAEWQNNLASMRNLGLLYCSERKLRHAMNDFDSGLSTLAYRMLETTQAERMVVTLGKRGAVVFSRPSDDPSTAEWRGRLLGEYLPSFADRVLDHLGCGEVLMTVSTLATVCGANPMQGAYLGSLAAAVQIAQLGPTAVASADTRRRMLQRPELVPPIGIQPFIDKTAAEGAKSARCQFDRATVA